MTLCTAVGMSPGTHDIFLAVEHLRQLLPRGAGSNGGQGAAVHCCEADEWCITRVVCFASNDVMNSKRTHSLRIPPELSLAEFSSRYVGNRPHPARSEQPWTAIFWGCCSSIQCCKSYRSSRYIFRLRQAVAARATFGIRLLEAVERIWRLFVIATQVKARCLYQGHPSHTVHE